MFFDELTTKVKLIGGIFLNVSYWFNSSENSISFLNLKVIDLKDFKEKKSPSNCFKFGNIDKQNLDRNEYIDAFLRITLHPTGLPFCILKLILDNFEQVNVPPLKLINSKIIKNVNNVSKLVVFKEKFKIIFFNFGKCLTLS